MVQKRFQTTVQLVTLWPFWHWPFNDAWPCRDVVFHSQIVSNNRKLFLCEKKSRKTHAYVSVIHEGLQRATGRCHICENFIKVGIVILDFTGEQVVAEVVQSTKLLHSNCRILCVIRISTDILEIAKNGCQIDLVFVADQFVWDIL